MDTHILSQALLALVIGISVANVFEPIHLMKQLNSLAELIDDEDIAPLKKPRITPNIVQAAIAGSVAVGIISLVVFVAIRLINQSLETSLFVSICVLVIVKITNSMQIDRLHMSISLLKDRYRL